MNSVIIVAAGKGTRMKKKINKAFIDIEGKQMLAHTIKAFYDCSLIDEIIVAVSESEIDKLKEDILGTYSFKNIKIVVGGAERQNSIYNSLKVVDEKAKTVLIHDGARPFIDQESIARVITKAKEKKAAILAIPVTDTIKVVTNSKVKSTPSREFLWAAQTPQAFDRDLIVEAHEKANKEKFFGTDDSMLVEWLGYEVSIVMGSGDNIKITRPEDLDIAKLILEKRKMEEMFKNRGINKND